MTRADLEEFILFEIDLSACEGREKVLNDTINSIKSLTNDALFELKELKQVVTSLKRQRTIFAVLSAGAVVAAILIGVFK